MEEKDQKERLVQITILGEPLWSTGRFTDIPGVSYDRVPNCWISLGKSAEANSAKSGIG